MYFSKKMIDIQSIVTNGVITFSSRYIRSIGTYPARNLNKTLITYLYLTHYSRTIHAQYTHIKRTIPIASLKDRRVSIAVYSAQRIQKYLCPFSRMYSSSPSLCILQKRGPRQSLWLCGVLLHLTPRKIAPKCDFSCTSRKFSVPLHP